MTDSPRPSPERPLVDTGMPEARRQQLVDLGVWVSIPLVTISSRRFLEGGARLDGGYYAHQALAAQAAIEASGYDLMPLHSITSDIFILGRFRRVYATDAAAGWPYLSASDALGFRPTSDKIIAREQAPRDAERHFVKSGWILVSSSGTVGRATIAGERLERFFLTHDLIRVVPGPAIPAGYVYAFLSSSIGQALITKDQYGAAIKHLEPHHISKVLVPMISPDEQLQIDKEIRSAFTLREEANTLLDEAEDLLHKYLGLPRLDLGSGSYFPEPKTAAPGAKVPHPRAFETSVGHLEERLDASFHDPIARSATNALKHSSAALHRLGDLAEDVIVPPRFKRIYVAKEHGIPFMQGSHLPQVRPYDQKFLSRTRQPHLEQWIIREGWVLVTCSGTIGRVACVSSHQDGWAASQHLLRIVANTAVAHPGFIAAFLSSGYGQTQLAAKIYGGVVDELTEQDARNIWIAMPPMDEQHDVGERVLKAFELKSEAEAAEREAIASLERHFYQQSTLDI